MLSPFRADGSPRSASTDNLTAPRPYRPGVAPVQGATRFERNVSSSLTDANPFEDSFSRSVSAQSATTLRAPARQSQMYLLPRASPLPEPRVVSRSPRTMYGIELTPTLFACSIAAAFSFVAIVLSLGASSTSPVQRELDDPNSPLRAYIQKAMEKALSQWLGDHERPPE